MDSKASLSKIALGGLIGGVAGAVGFYGRSRISNSKLDPKGKAERIFDKSVKGMGDGYNEAGQKVFESIQDAILRIECAPFIYSSPGDYVTCMRGY